MLLVNIKISYQTVEEIRGKSWNAQCRYNRWQETGWLRGQQTLPWVLLLVNVFLTYCNVSLLNGEKVRWWKMSDFLQVSSTESVFKNLAEGVEGGKAHVSQKPLQYHIMLRTHFYWGRKKSSPHNCGP